MPRATPNYLNVTPTGETRAVFEGGVEINANTDNVWPSSQERRVTWVRQGDRSLVADITGRNTFGGATLDMRVRRDDGQGDNLFSLNSYPSESNAYVTMNNPNHGGYIRTAMLMNSLGQSSFLQIGRAVGNSGAKEVHISGGYVDAAGNVPAGGFFGYTPAINHWTTGIYDIWMTNNFPYAIALTGFVTGGGHSIAQIIGVNPGITRVTLLTGGSAPTHYDAPFYYITAHWA